MGYYFGCSHWIWAVCLLCAACFLFPVAQGQGIEWLKRPVTTSAREGENVTFTCRLNVEDPNIIWVKNVDGQASTTILFVKDSRFEADDRLYIINRYDLVITDVRRSDNGQYACRTKDAGIQAANLTVLLFPGQPSISRSKRGPVYTEDDDVTFTCSSTGGNPNPTITWLKNGNISTAVQQVSEATSVGGTTSSAITVRLDKTDHQANYSCLVSNELNFNSPLVGSTLVSVQYSPSIAFRPYSPVYAVRLGESAQVTCDVDANPQVTSVRWSKDGVNLAGTAPQRVLSPASKSDSGEYTCTATNSIGEKSGKLRVDVQYPPIVKAEASIVVPEGKDVVVECEVDSNPQPYEVQWSRERPSGSSQTLVTASTLSLMSVTRDQAGNYSCSAQNQLKLSGKRADFREGKAFSYIYVQYQPGPASIGPVPDVDVGERLDITCTAEPRGYPEASYRWTKDGQSLSETRQTLTIASVSLLDNGRYSCTPSNSQGSGQAAFVEVNVFEPPMIINPPTPEISMFLADPRLLTLTCEAQGYPQPQVTWFRTGDNQPLNINTDFFTVVVKTTPVDDYSVKVESSLQFKGSQREESTEAGSSQGMQLLINDMGNYSCHAESEKHSEVPVASTQIFINFPPALTLTPIRLAVTAGDQAVFRCAAQAHPDPGFQWFFRGRQLSSAVGMVITSEKVQGVVGGFQSRLVLSRVSDRSYGQYSCLVANALGNATRYIQLSRKSSPEQPGDLTAVSVTWESALLRWQPGFDGGFSQDFYVQRSGGSEEPRRLKVTPSSAISYNVTKLRPSATYTFQVLPENDMGFGKASSPITITTNALKIPTLPKIPVYEAGQRKLVVVPPSSYGNNYCLRVEVRGEGGKWSPVNGCMKVMGDTLEIAHTGITAVNVSVCLSIRTDVCGVPTAAEINDNRSDPILTETHVIIIACVCGIIIVTLLIILFCFIFRRRKNAAKNYESGTPAGDPPPYTSVNSGPQKKPHQNSSGGAVVANSGGYDNQDGPLELQHQPPADDAAAMLYLGRHHGQQQHSQNSPRRLADEEKHLYENQLNQWSENNRMENYPNRDAQSPNKDKYIDLQDRGGGGDMLDYGAGDPSGQPGAGGGAGGGGKPKKVIYEVVV